MGSLRLVGRLSKPQCEQEAPCVCNRLRRSKTARARSGAVSDGPPRQRSGAPPSHLQPVDRGPAFRLARKGLPHGRSRQSSEGPQRSAGPAKRVDGRDRPCVVNALRAQRGPYPVAPPTGLNPPTPLSGEPQFCPQILRKTRFSEGRGPSYWPFRGPSSRSRGAVSPSNRPRRPAERRQEPTLQANATTPRSRSETTRARPPTPGSARCRAARHREAEHANRRPAAQRRDPAQRHDRSPTRDDGPPRRPRGARVDASRSHGARSGATIKEQQPGAAPRSLTESSEPPQDVHRTAVGPSCQDAATGRRTGPPRHPTKAADDQDRDEAEGDDEDVHRRSDRQHTRRERHPAATLQRQERTPPEQRGTRTKNRCRTGHRAGHSSTAETMAIMEIRTPRPHGAGVAERPGPPQPPLLRLVAHAERHLQTSLP